MIYQRDSIEGPLQAVAETLGSVCSKYGKAYCYPSQLTIMRLVEEYHDIKISRRTLNRVLRWLEDHGYFKRIRRHREGPDGRILFATTLYMLKKKIFIRLNSIKKWIDRVSSPLRVPLRAQYKSRRKNEISTSATGNVGILLKSVIEGKPSPVSLDG
jgi:DNA-binding HxlR family transcriptional regulator